MVNPDSDNLPPPLAQKLLTRFLRNDLAEEVLGDLDERLTAIDIRIDGDMATAWTPYKFYYKGNFSHCGVNALQLIKTAAGWKIWSIIDTRRKEGCE